VDAGIAAFSLAIEHTIGQFVQAGHDRTFSHRRLTGT
jgi:hypothetical protein